MLWRARISVLLLLLRVAAAVRTAGAVAGTVATEAAPVAVVAAASAAVAAAAFDNLLVLERSFLVPKRTFC